MKLESVFEKEFCKALRQSLGDEQTYTFKLTAAKGIPDRLILHKDKYALLEFKQHKDAKKQPGQETWINHFGNLAYAAIVYPENAEKVMQDILNYFE